MSLLFAPGSIGKVEIKNRLVRAPTFEGLADDSGRVTDELVSVYRRLAEGDVGLILSGFMYVHRIGQVMRRQVGISSDDAVAGLSRLAEVVHAGGGRIALEMSHGGRQASAALIGRRPHGPSAVHRDPTWFIVGARFRGRAAGRGAWHQPGVHGDEGQVRPLPHGQRRRSAAKNSSARPRWPASSGAAPDGGMTLRHCKR